MANYQRIEQLLDGAQCVLDGSSLDIASVVGVAKYVEETNIPKSIILMFRRYGVSASLSTDGDMLGRIDQSVEMLKRHLRDGHLVYGKAVHFLTSAQSFL